MGNAWIATAASPKQHRCRLIVPQHSAVALSLHPTHTHTAQLRWVHHLHMKTPFSNWTWHMRMPQQCNAVQCAATQRASVGISTFAIVNRPCASVHIRELTFDSLNTKSFFYFHFGARRSSTFFVLINRNVESRNGRLHRNILGLVRNREQRQCISSTECDVCKWKMCNRQSAFDWHAVLAVAHQTAVHLSLFRISSFISLWCGSECDEWDEKKSEFKSKDLHVGRMRACVCCSVGNESFANSCCAQNDYSSQIFCIFTLRSQRKPETIVCCVEDTILLTDPLCVWEVGKCQKIKHKIGTTTIVISYFVWANPFCFWYSDDNKS